jgi:hypothetical protein
MHASAHCAPLLRKDMSHTVSYYWTGNKIANACKSWKIVIWFLFRGKEDTSIRQLKRQPLLGWE